MRITAAGKVGIGNPASLSAGNTPPSYPELIVGLAVDDENGSSGLISACANTTESDGQVGLFGFANYAVPAANKLIAAIDCETAGALNSGVLKFHTWNAGVVGERMRITAAGRVGIGNNAAVLPYEAAAGTVHLIVGPTAPPGYVWGQITAAGSTSSSNVPVGMLSFANYANSGSEKRIAEIRGQRGDSDNSGFLSFVTWSAGVAEVRMTITSLGNVGVGNAGSWPPYTAGGYTHLIVGSTGAPSYPGSITACGAETALNANVGVLAFANYAITATDKRVAAIYGSTANASNSGDLRFLTWNAGAASEWMRINSAGNVGIGLSTPNYKLHLSTDSAAKPGTNTWTIASDIRTKRNAQRFEGDMDVIRRLDPIVAEYNGLGGTPEGARVVSFDPAALREIVPPAVSSVRAKLNPDDAEDTEILGVNTHEIFFHMLRAIQQIDQRLSQQEHKTESKPSGGGGSRRQKLWP
jgi:hypothetical protein